MLEPGGASGGEVFGDIPKPSTHRIRIHFNPSINSTTNACLALHPDSAPVGESVTGIEALGKSLSHP